VRLALDTRSALVDALPELHLKNLGRTHKPARQDFLAELITSSYERTRPHRLYSYADSFSIHYLCDGLRCTPNGSHYKNLLRPFFEFTEENRGYDAKKGLTKQYQLRPHVREVLDRIYSGDEPLPVVRVDTGERVETLPTSGIPATVPEVPDVPSVIALDPRRLTAAAARVTGWIDACGPWMPLDESKASTTQLPDALRTLKVARQYAISIGGIPNFYELYSHGRLGPVGFHVIKIPKAVRRLTFEGSGLADFDIASCFASIFVSLGRAIGFPSDVTEAYLHEKARWHLRWKRLVKVCHPDAFKAVVSSFFTGGTLSSSHKTENVRNLGADVMRLLGDDTEARLLLAEVRAGMKQVIRHADRVRDGRETVFVNSVKTPLVVEGTAADFGRLSCHLLTGYEQFAIREFCRLAKGIQGIIYDGFIAAPQSTVELEEHVRARSTEVLGVTLDLRLKQEDLSGPMPDLEPDPNEF
jgi:hypothetical protein